MAKFDKQCTFPSTQKNPDESLCGFRSSIKEKVRSSASMQMPADIEPIHTESPSDGRSVISTTKTTTKEAEEEDLHASPKEPINDVDSNVLQEYSTQPVADFSIPGFSSCENHDNGEIQPVIPDSYVSVRNYRVKASVAPVLQSIIEKHGDIAANCRLHSPLIHTYDLEYLCFVVHKLRSTTFEQLTSSNIDEMLAVLADAEPAQIDVNWLLKILNELKQAKEFIRRQSNYDLSIEKTKKELEIMLEGLSLKEKAHIDELHSNY